MSGSVRALLGEIRLDVEQLYGPRLRGVYLFGSHARGEADAESDVDILVVLDRVERPALEIARTSLLISAASPRHRLSVSRVFVPEAEWERGSSNFLQNVRDEAVAA
jgi:predicted nucleotidyltransferase